MTSAVRSVRFSENLPKVCDKNAMIKNVTKSNEQTSQATIQLPRVYDDVLYSPYDIYTAASIGDTCVIEVRHLHFHIYSFNLDI